MFVFRPCPCHRGGTSVTSLAILGGHFFPNCLFLDLGVLGKAPCGCSSSAEVMGFAVVSAEMWVSAFCWCFPGAHQVPVSLSKVSSEKIDQMHMVTPL